MQLFYEHDSYKVYGQPLTFPDCDVKCLDVVVHDTDTDLRSNHWELWGKDQDEINIVLYTFVTKGWTFSYPSALTESTEVGFEMFFEDDDNQMEENFCAMLMPPSKCEAESSLASGQPGRTVH